MESIWRDKVENLRHQSAYSRSNPIVGKIRMVSCIYHKAKQITITKKEEENVKTK